MFNLAQVIIIRVNSIENLNCSLQNEKMKSKNKNPPISSAALSITEVFRYPFYLNINPLLS